MPKMISLYQDTMISLGGVGLNKENKATRTRQIQFRMDPNKVKRLLAAIAYDDNMHSMADLFNKAADDYLKKQERTERNNNGTVNKNSSHK